MTERKSLLAQALALPRRERVSLAHDLLESLDEPSEDPDAVEAAWWAEVQRRAREIADGSADLVDWDEVRAEALARVRRT